MVVAPAMMVVMLVVVAVIHSLFVGVIAMMVVMMMAPRKLFLCIYHRRLVSYPCCFGVRRSNL